MTATKNELLAFACLRAALSYERRARLRPNDPKAPFWRSMAETCRSSAESLMGWPRSMLALSMDCVSPVLLSFPRAREGEAPAPGEKGRNPDR